MSSPSFEHKYWELRASALMAKRRLDDFADKANAGQVHYSARELKRKIGSAFAEVDVCLNSSLPNTSEKP